MTALRLTECALERYLVFWAIDSTALIELNFSHNPKVSGSNHPRNQPHHRVTSKATFASRASRLRVGNKVVIAVTDRDPRCKMFTLDPDTAQPNPEVMRGLARDHEGKAGVYAAVVVEGMIRPNDKITLQE